MKKGLLYFTILLLTLPIFSQEVLKSPEEEYLDFLSLDGISQRPTLVYRTLSDSNWTLAEDKEHIWQDNLFGKKFIFWEIENKNENFFLKDMFQGISLRLYGPVLFNSYNTASPFGQNDGVLWQGKGYNTSLTAGLRMEGFGFELTLKPKIAYSQNLAFKIMDSAYGDGYGYFWGYCDAPQRFGDSDFFAFDWNDSEVRYTWKTFTLGFGTQAIWLGPAQINPLLGSNHAASYPKFDIGLRPTRIIIPYFNWDIGTIEGRLWLGKLTESEYFDDDESNNNNQISGFSIAYQPSFIKGFTIGFNKVCICKWAYEYRLQYFNPFFDQNTLITEGNRGEDQKASLTLDWKFDEVGFDIYAEIGVDDFLANGLKLYEYARYPFHTITYTVGFKKSFDVSSEKKLKGLLQFEWNMTEASQDYQMWAGSQYNFGFHYQIKQGYTNKGQWLGSGIGYGGNSQYLSYTLYGPFGYSKLFLSRNNPDNNYIYSKCVDNVASSVTKYYTAFKANLFIGTENYIFITKNISLLGNFTYNLVINPCYECLTKEKPNWSDYTYLNNFHFELGISIKI